MVQLAQRQVQACPSLQLGLPRPSCLCMAPEALVAAGVAKCSRRRCNTHPLLGPFLHRIRHFVLCRGSVFACAVCRPLYVPCGGCRRAGMEVWVGAACLWPDHHQTAGSPSGGLCFLQQLLQGSAGKASKHACNCCSQRVVGVCMLSAKELVAAVGASAVPGVACLRHLLVMAAVGWQAAEPAQLQANTWVAAFQTREACRDSPATAVTAAECLMVCSWQWQTLAQSPQGCPWVRVPNHHDPGAAAWAYHARLVTSREHTLQPMGCPRVTWAKEGRHNRSCPLAMAVVQVGAGSAVPAEYTVVIEQ